MALIFAICIFAFFLILTAYLYKRNKPDTAETSFSNPTEPIQTPHSPFAVETTSTLPQDRKITPEFMEVANAIKRKENVILVTGGAGTGKTTLIEWLVEQGLVDVVLAFTGAAALNCHGQTIHSFFSLPLTVQDPKGSFDKSVKDAVYSIIEHAHAIVIDEISMVRADLMDAVDRRLKEVLKNAAPFGGVQMLLVGDPYQLPPVVTKKEESFFRRYRKECIWNSEWFFDAHVFKNCKISHYALTTVFRQTGEEVEYMQYLNYARQGKKLEKVVEYFNSHCYEENEDDNAVTLTADNREAKKRNERELNKLPGELFMSKAKALGAFAEIIRNSQERRQNDPDELDDVKNLPAPYKLKLKEGARVMFLVNDPARRFVNGSIGIVRKITGHDHTSPDNVQNDNYITVQLTNGNTVTINKYEWKSEKLKWNSEEKKIERDVDGTYIQYPLTLAWAITTHKAQGRTLPKVQIYYSHGAFQPGQIYVALSRTRRILDLKLLSRLSEAYFYKDDRLEEWIKEIKRQKIKSARDGQESA